MTDTENSTCTLEIAELETERLPLSEVAPHPQNPNTHSDRQIKELQASLQEHGYAAGSMTVQRSTMRLVKGHGVYEALQGTGCVEADFVIADMDDAEALLFLARDNRLSDLSAFDVPKLKAITVELQKIDVPLERIGFHEGEFKSLESDWAKSEADNRVVVEDEPPEVSEEEPITQTGDLWHLGSHRVLCGDSTCAEDIGRVMGDEKADMVLTDPPYGIKRDKGFGNHRGFGGQGNPIASRQYTDDWDSERPRKSFFDALMSYADDIVIFGGNYFADLLPRSTHWIVWDKLNTMPTYGDCELIWTNSERKSVKKITFEYNGLIGKEKDRFHPTQKPVGVLTAIMEAYESQVIFDPFLGSGTTLIAADQLDRVCYGLEIAPKYCDVIVKRYIKHRESSEDVWVERGTDRITWEQITRSVKVV